MWCVNTYAASAPYSMLLSKHGFRLLHKRMGDIEFLELSQHEQVLGIFPLEGRNE